jgi:hypothetical protein
MDLPIFCSPDNVLFHYWDERGKGYDQPLLQRELVFQESILSWRIIYYDSEQIYWEFQNATCLRGAPIYARMKTRLFRISESL